MQKHFALSGKRQRLRFAVRSNENFSLWNFLWDSFEWRWKETRMTAVQDEETTAILQQLETVDDHNRCTLSVEGHAGSGMSQREERRCLEKRHYCA